MIRYRLVCDGDHEFEGWFRNSEAYEAQVGRGHVICPQCGSHRVSKALMAPNVATSRRDTERSDEPSRPRQVVRDVVRKIREHVESTADYVGDRFADEARKIHYQEVEPRGIYGEATAAEAKDLKDEGVEFHPLPSLPEEHN